MVENINEILTEGLIVKNYKEMCLLLNENEKTSKGKKLQLQDWNRYFSFENNGQKFIIGQIFNEPLMKNDGRGKASGSRANNSIYIKYIEILLLYIFTQHKSQTIVCTKNYLFLTLGMVDDRYLSKSIRSTLIKTKAYKDYEIHEFDRRAYPILDRILFSALNSLQNRFLINWKQELHYTIFDLNNNKIDCCATEDEEIAYTSAKYEIAKQMGIEEGSPEKYDHLRDIFFYHKSEEFYEKLKDRLYDDFGWDSTYVAYKIIYKNENVLDAIPRTEKQLMNKLENQKELNSKIIEALNNNAQTKYNNMVDKYENSYKEVCELNGCEYGMLPLEVTNTYKPPYNYIERQKKLAEELIRLKDKKSVLLKRVNTN